jgi:hypothetical protein
MRTFCSRGCLPLVGARCIFVHVMAVWLGNRCCVCIYAGEHIKAAAWVAVVEQSISDSNADRVSSLSPYSA